VAGSREQVFNFLFLERPAISLPAERLLILSRLYRMKTIRGRVLNQVVLNY
jgi:hypothetical protein